MKLGHFFTGVGLLGALMSPTFAAVTYTTGSYTQNFNSLSGVSTWTNNTTLAGWYAATTATPSITTIGSNTGSTTAAGLYSFGVAGTNALTERSLGYIASNAFTGASAVGQGFLGVQLTNGSGSTLTTITLSYDGEEWRKEANAASQSIVVEYSLNATSLTTGTWTSAGSSLTFTSPIVGATGTTVLDGNASANRSTAPSNTVTSLTWIAGTDLWIRFVDLNDSGNDHALAIDNFAFTAVPEPNAAALLGSLGALGIFRRRR